MPRLPGFVRIVAAVAGAHLLVFLCYVAGGSCSRRGDATPPADAPGDAVATPPAAEEYVPRRPPAKFPRNSHLPAARESEASGPIVPPLFSAGRDLVYVDDARVWWESDHDKDDDDEDDHSMHYAIVAPFRRLADYVCASNATLKVQECYRANGVHNPRSLHREGRALDLTASGMDLETLAKLAWMSGFDWVYLECPRGGGPHVHASVKRTRADAAPPAAPAPAPAAVSQSR